jgi:hypothetical protein
MTKPTTGNATLNWRLEAEVQALIESARVCRDPDCTGHQRPD